MDEDDDNDMEGFHTRKRVVRDKLPCCRGLKVRSDVTRSGEALRGAARRRTVSRGATRIFPVTYVCLLNLRSSI